MRTTAIHSTRFLPSIFPILLGWGSLLLAGCSAPSINLETQEPIKVDIQMRLDVFQHEGASKEATPTASPSASPSPSPPLAKTPEERQKIRSGDIQTMKNSRLVGEGRDGFLVIRTDPGGDYGSFLRETVRAENADRMQIFTHLAAEEKIPVTEVQTRAAKLAANRAFKGEWIEIDQDGSHTWKQKTGE